MVAADAGRVHVLHEARDVVGEGVWWSARAGAVFWVDILGQTLHRLTLADHVVTDWAMPATIGWIVEREHREGFIAGIGRDIVELDLAPLALRPIVRLEPELTQNRLNDAIVDRRGRLWAGTMPLTADRPDGSLYRLDPDGSLARLDTGYRVTNGPVISGDGDTLFHTDSPAGLVYSFPMNDDGSLGVRRVHITFDPSWGSPDGMTIDAEGGLWIAHWGGGQVSRFDAHGRRERSIALPASQITNCVFGGAALDRLFVTSARLGRDAEPLAGALFEVDAGVRGLPACRYGN